MRGQQVAHSTGLGITHTAQCLDKASTLYAGWIAESRKMAYKADFKPIEGLMDEGWRVLEQA